MKVSSLGCLEDRRLLTCPNSKYVKVEICCDGCDLFHLNNEDMRKLVFPIVAD
jgi:hypothetical protein